jgi:hypothetical protein
MRSLQDYMNITLPMRAKNLADKEGLAQSRRQHELMIELLKGRDSWAFAQLCVDQCSTASRIISGGSRRMEASGRTRTHPRAMTAFFVEQTRL